MGDWSLAQEFRKELPLVGLGSAFCLFYWLAEGFVESQIFQLGHFWERVVAPDPQQITERIAVSILIIAMAFASKDGRRVLTRMSTSPILNGEGENVSDGSSVHITWDVTCPAGAYNIDSGPLSAVATGGYTDFSTCGLPPTGSANVPLGAGNLFFIVIPTSGTIEGSHGRDSSAVERPWSGVGHCGILSKDTMGTCP